MSAFTNFAENKIIKAIFGNTSLSTLGDSIYVALFNEISDGETSSVTEVSGTGYSRKQVIVAKWNTDSVTGEARNTDTIDFGTAGGSWGTVKHVGIYDAATAGNLWMYGALSAQRVVNTNDPVGFASGTLICKVL